MLRLPIYYKNSVVINALLNAMQIELDLVDGKITDTQNQFYVNFATTLLALHEQDVGLPVDIFSSNDIRRSRIISRMRGAGTTTIDKIKSVALSFNNGDVDVTEDFANYKFQITFVSNVGVPTNISDFQKAIDNVKPAHLAVEYIFTYNLCSTVKLKTCATIKTITCNELLNSDLGGI